MPTLYTGLPEYWKHGTRFRGHRITTLPRWYRRKALHWQRLPDIDRAALIAAEGFEQMAADQQEGF